MDHLPAIRAISSDDIIRGFVPTRRFARVSFETYVPDPRYPSQQETRERLQAFAMGIGQSRRAHLLGRLIRQTGGPRGIYLDGGYGVGKTHLLAATYHAVGDERLYLSFGELAYTISRLGLEPTLDALANTRLLCIDEFELDDVAQTRMASTLLGRLFGRRGKPISLVTTSNTLPSDLGQGRFAADSFQREIGEIANAFEVLTIDGEDYRHRHWDELAMATGIVADRQDLHQAYVSDPAPDSTKVWTDWTALMRQMEAVHPIQYPQIASRLEALYVDGLERIDDQAVALRLVHFVDKLYDQAVRLAVTTNHRLPLGEIFSTSYRHGGYEKKYRRCLSRLHELISETSAATRSPLRASGREQSPAPPSGAHRADPAPAD